MQSCINCSEICIKRSLNIQHFMKNIQWHSETSEVETFFVLTWSITTKNLPQAKTNLKKYFHFTAILSTKGKKSMNKFCGFLVFIFFVVFCFVFLFGFDEVFLQDFCFLGFWLVGWFVFFVCLWFCQDNNAEVRWKNICFQPLVKTFSGVAHQTHQIFQRTYKHETPLLNDAYFYKISGTQDKAKE